MTLNRTLLDLLLTMFLTNALGVVLYCALFGYSFNRKSRFLLRLILSLLMVGGVATGLAFGVYYGFVGGFETTLLHIEMIRVVVNLLSLLSALAVFFVCFDEKPTLILFATVMGNAGHCLGTNLYEMLIQLLHIDSIYLTMYNGYDWLSFMLYYAAHLSLFAILYYSCARSFAKTTKTFDSKINKSIVAAFVFFTYVMTGVQGSNVFNAAYNGTSLEAVSIMFHSILSLLYILIIFILRAFLVWVHMLHEKQAEKAFYDSYREKMELQEQNVDLINRKCHDMKHQIRTLLEGQNLDSEFIEETQNAIAIFDAHVQTGNATLDTLLTQKSLLCETNDIQLTVMIDGATLSFLSVQDINSFFGNAIDNAIEYLKTVEKEKRFIRISSLQQGSIFTIRVENYCETALLFNKEGLPKTTKGEDGYHGFGSKSIRQIARKYGGDASFERKDDLFILTAIFMI